MQVREVMSTDLVTATPQTPITQVAKMMENANVGAVIIQGTNGPAGIVTDRDLVIKHLAAGHTNDCPVEEAMTADRPIAGLVTITPDTDILDAAAQLGQRKVGRLPVVDNGRIVGILSAGDVSKELRRALDGLLGEGAKASDA
jgi:CBS domain-containing protein